MKKFSLSPNVIFLSLVSCLNDISSEMIIPLMPLLIKDVGGSGIALGLIGGLRDSFANMLKFIFGYLSDHWGVRKPFIYWGYITALSFRMGLLWAGTWQHILLFVGLERIGKGMRTAPRDALISFSSHDHLGQGFGFHRAMDTFGAILGSLLVACLLGFFHMSLTGIFIISTGIAVISLIPMIWVHEVEHKNNAVLPSIHAINFSPSFIVFTVIASLFSLANISYMFFMVHAQQVINHHGTFLTPIILYVFFNVFYSFSAIPLGVLSDRMDRRKVLMWGYAIFGLMLLGFAKAKTIPAFTICFILYGIALAITKVGHSAMVSMLSRSEHRATALGVFDTATGIVTLIGGVLLGWFWETIDHRALFGLASIIIFVSAASLFVCKRFFVYHENGNGEV